MAPAQSNRKTHRRERSDCRGSARLPLQKGAVGVCGHRTAVFVFCTARKVIKLSVAAEANILAAPTCEGRFS